MANTYTHLVTHIIFSTKGREPWLGEHIRVRVWKYLGGIIKANQCIPMKIGGYHDHAHVLLAHGPDKAVSNIVRDTKAGSSKWIHEQFPDMKGFGWQRGYGAFSVSLSQISATKEYIAGQEEHHKVVMFQDEYRIFLKKHRIDFDEQYTWG